MDGIRISHDTSLYEVPAILDAAGKLTPACVEQAVATINTHGLVILTDLLSPEEAAVGLDMVRQTIEDPARARCTFASETDNLYLRRDFCPLPANLPVMTFTATLCQRIEHVLLEYCGRSHPLLEVTTLTSYRGSSHQYLHRDPAGVILITAAVEDVSPEQGGTVFVPGSHMYFGAERRHGGTAYELMELFRIRANCRIFWHNLKKLWAMRTSTDAPLAPGEFRDRVFSRQWDEHQPNLLRFVLGKNRQFSLRKLGPRTLWKLYRHASALTGLYHVVQTAPKKGTVILYRSDLIHAGADNCSPDPRRLVSLNFARDIFDLEYWQGGYSGYSPHATLLANPQTLGDILSAPTWPAPSDQPKRDPMVQVA